MNNVAISRLLTGALLVTACSGGQAERQTVDGSESAAPEAAESTREPQGSGATDYVPAKSKVPNGAIDRQLLDRVLAAGPGWLLSQVPLQPTFAAKHKFAGFKLVSVFRNDPKVLRYGVLPGDIVRAVNDQKLVTPGDLLLVFERLKTADVLEISIQRDGADRQFRWPILPALAVATTATPTAAP